MSKLIIFCADGTWNGPDKDDDGDQRPDPTNVYKLFCRLAGDVSEKSLLEANEQEKELADNGQLLQVAKYIHGVGDSRNPINKILGGAFGSGIIKRIVRGYTFISRHYEPGDDIVVTGFSRGAYTARALAGLIASQGLLARPLTQDREGAYRAGAQAWYRYRAMSKEEPGFLERLVEAVVDLPAFISTRQLQAQDLVPVDRIKAIGVWDTVGALGLPKYMHDRRIDSFKFTDNQLSRKVEKGFHAVALDEQREDFTPTLWARADNVVEVLFPGAHADVGGGYTTNQRESGLSDIALDWMIQQLQTVGVKFNSGAPSDFAPDPAGTAHRPWEHPPFNFPGKSSARQFRGTGLRVHPSVEARMGAGNVCADPDAGPEPYRPRNLP